MLPNQYIYHIYHPHDLSFLNFFYFYFFIYFFFFLRQRYHLVGSGGWGGGAGVEVRRSERLVPMLEKDSYNSLFRVAFFPANL